MTPTRSEAALETAKNTEPRLRFASARAEAEDGLHRDLTQRQHLRFRAALSAEQTARLPIALAAPQPAAWFGIVSLSAIAVTTFFVDGLRYTVPSFLPFLALMSVWYARARRAGRA